MVDSAGGTVFPEPLVPGLLQQCSRATAADVVGYWTPTLEQIAALEAGLPSLVGARLRLAAGDTATRHSGVAYYRQYGGIVHRGGRRTIYVNGFTRDHLQESDANWWRSEPVSVCDGGTAYFGVEFDPATGRFESLHFNGRA